MPIIVDNTFHPRSLGVRLKEQGAHVISEEAAHRQDIRPVRIGLLNLMPAQAMHATETQWLRGMSRSVLQIEPVFMKFDGDVREDGKRGPILKRYVPFSEVAEGGLDGLIVTGDNLELAPESTPDRPKLMPFEGIRYAPQLGEVMDWAKERVYSTIYSCLASHFALHHFFGIERDEPSKKIFGVYEHEVSSYPSRYTEGLNDTIRAPHSRWGNVSIQKLGRTSLQVLAAHDSVGWLLAEAPNQAGGTDVFIQGHPEYDRWDLHKEYVRDRAIGQEMPAQYYPEAEAQNDPRLTWQTDARALHANWIDAIYGQIAWQNGTE